MTGSESHGAAAFQGLVTGIAAAAAGMLQRVGALLDGSLPEGAPGADGAAAEVESPERRAEAIRTGLAHARQYVDTLVMLQQKTKGNLTQDEEQLLNAVLTDLRLSVVKLDGRWRSTTSG